MSDWIGGLTVGLTWGAACVAWLGYWNTRKAEKRMEQSERDMLVLFDKITRRTED